MKTPLSLLSALLWALSLLSTSAKEQTKERELIQDNHFRQGFVLSEPKPGQHVRYGELRGREAKAKPVWGLSQWSSRFPLTPADLAKNSHRLLIYRNSAKTITLGGSADISLAAQASVEYGTYVRKVGDPWLHLLVEQEFEPTAPLAELSAARLHIEVRLRQSHLAWADGYTPDVHAAQFVLYFTVQNRNRQSPGHGDLVWFGIPLYDNRHRLAPEFKAQDFGGTAKFIFMPDAKTFLPASTHDSQWVTVKKDLLPLMREALTTAWARGFLTASRAWADYHIGGMNMGWELPGIFDVEMQVRNLSLKAVFHPKRTEKKKSP